MPDTIEQPKLDDLLAQADIMREQYESMLLDPEVRQRIADRKITTDHLKSIHALSALVKPAVRQYIFANEIQLSDLIAMAESRSDSYLFRFLMADHVVEIITHSGLNSLAQLSQLSALAYNYNCPYFLAYLLENKFTFEKLKKIDPIAARSFSDTLFRDFITKNEIDITADYAYNKFGYFNWTAPNRNAVLLGIIDIQTFKTTPARVFYKLECGRGYGLNSLIVDKVLTMQQLANLTDDEIADVRSAAKKILAGETTAEAITGVNPRGESILSKRHRVLLQRNPELKRLIDAQKLTFAQFAELTEREISKLSRNELRWINAGINTVEEVFGVSADGTRLVLEEAVEHNRKRAVLYIANRARDAFAAQSEASILTLESNSIVSLRSRMAQSI